VFVDSYASSRLWEQDRTENCGKVHKRVRPSCIQSVGSNGNDKCDLQFAMIMDTLLGGVHHRVINLHNCGLITASVTVVWRRENRDNAPIVLPLVSFHHQLVGTGNEMKTVDVCKLLSDILPECISGSPR
jgi:hypothetical protein